MSQYMDNDGSQAVGVVPERGNKSALGLTAPQTFPAKRVFSVSVTALGASPTAGTVSDGPGVIAAIPAAIGVYVIDFPVNTGQLTVTPGTNMTVSVSYGA